MRRQQARERARSHTCRRAIDKRDIVCTDWFTTPTFHNIWMLTCSRVAAGLTICAFCAMISFGPSDHTLILPIENEEPPAFFTVPHLHKYIIQQETNNWWLCDTCMRNIPLRQL